MKTKLLRGQILSFKGDPFLVGDEASIHYESDGLIAMENGKIKRLGAYQQLKNDFRGQEIEHFAHSLILPGFIDTHVHYPQVQIMGAYGKQLIDWLEAYTFPAEKQFETPEHAKKSARFFIEECLRAGTTTAAVYGTVHAHSVEAFFQEAEALNMRMIAGKVLMDRNAPSFLQDTAQRGYDESKALIKKWHGKKRLGYAITPRFAPTSTPSQLKLAGALWKEHPGTHMQTHLAENKKEIQWVKKLFPQRQSYLDVYDHYGLTGKRAIFGHGIHLTLKEWQLLHESGSALAHCPTSNGFLGSGLFSFKRAKNPKRPVRVGLASDIGAGTSFSALQSMNQAYKIAQLGGFSLSSACAFYLATRGAAEALYLEDRIGSLEAGMEADMVVLDLRSTPLMNFRMGFCQNILEVLFTLLTLGDDRATRAVYIAGEKVYDQKNQVSFSSFD